MDVLTSKLSALADTLLPLPRLPPAVQPVADKALVALGPALGLAMRAMRIMGGEPAGDVPVPAALDVASHYLSAGLASDALPFRLHHVDLGALPFARAVLVIALAPLIWNIIARTEFYTRIISRVVGRQLGAYALAVWIFGFSMYRDVLFVAAIESQPRVDWLGDHKLVALGGALYVVGIVLVLTSMARLGITGTYLGDYFGILMDAKVESFPFSVVDHPMYDGATMCFLGTAILYVSSFVASTLH
jgi:phosphatidylethanolamine/phosphatidyl-N-methylethanolamine N-methyltransferase